MMQLRDKFISLLVKAVNNHAIYLWSAQGEKVIDLSEEEIKMKYETSEANAKRVINHINMLKQYNWLTSKTKAYDCSGLVCHCLSSCKRESENFDLCADDLIKRYKKVDYPTAGCLVHRKGHIGVYIGYDNIIEAKGRDYGVIVSPFYRTEWEDFCNPFAT